MTYENRTENAKQYIRDNMGNCVYTYVKEEKKNIFQNIKLFQTIYNIIFSLSNMKQIFIEMIALMKRASKMKRLSGEEKKHFVMTELARIIPYDNAFEEILLDVINLLIDVENGKLTINKNVEDKATKCFDLFKCKK